MKTLMLMTGTAMLAMGGGAMAQDAATPQTDATARGAMAAETAPATPAAPAAEAGMQADAAATAQPVMPADPAAPQPAMSADASAPAQPATGAPAADPAKIQSAQATVDAGWSKYDKKGTGQLTPLEFGTWIMAAQGQDMSAQVDKSRTARSANLPAVKVLNATGSAFAKADTNRDKMVSREELTTFLASA